MRVPHRPRGRFVSHQLLHRLQVYIVHHLTVGKGVAKSVPGDIRQAGVLGGIANHLRGLHEIVDALCVKFVSSASPPAQPARSVHSSSCWSRSREVHEKAHLEPLTSVREAGCQSFCMPTDCMELIQQEHQNHPRRAGDHKSNCEPFDCRTKPEVA